MGTPQWRSSHRHPTIADYNGTVQWHHVHSPKVRRHPTPTIVHNGTVRWHRAMAPCPPSPPTIAHYNGTRQWHHVHSLKVGRHPPPPTIAHYNGTLRWDPAMAPRPLHPAIALVPRPICQSGSSPSPPIGSKNPYSYRYLGNNGILTTKLNQFSRWISEPSTTYQRQRASLSQTF